MDEITIIVVIIGGLAAALVLSSMLFRQSGNLAAFLIDLPGMVRIWSGAERKHLLTKIAERWQNADLPIYLMPVAANFDDDFATGGKSESIPGALGVVGDRDEAGAGRLIFYALDGFSRLSINGNQLRQYGIVKVARAHDSAGVVICTQTAMGWHAYRFTLPLSQTWQALARALAEISPLSPSTGIGPVNTMGYQQNMLGHWERTDFTTLYLITGRLILNWQDDIALDHIREISVLPSPGVNPLNAAMLCVKYASPGEDLRTVGFDMLFGAARDWANVLHEQTGAPLHIVDERKKKA